MTKPHMVHQRKAYESIDDETGRRYIGMTECPDCGQGLTSRPGDYFVCSTLDPSTVGIVGTKGDVVACGVKS